MGKMIKMNRNFLLLHLRNTISNLSNTNCGAFVRKIDNSSVIQIQLKILNQRARFIFQTTKPSHYETLKIKQAATSTEIKEAYIRGCKECHPDVSKSPEASEKFRQIQEAYQILSNPTTRISYDYQIGNIYQDTSHLDYDGVKVKSAKRDRKPGRSPAEDIVMQRWREQLIRKRRQREEGDAVEDDFEDSRRKEEERFKRFEERFYSKFNHVDNKARQHIHPLVYNAVMRRFLLFWGYTLIFMLLFSSILDNEETPNQFDNLEALRKVDKKEYKSNFQQWEEEKSNYFKNSPTVTVKSDKYD